MRNAKSPYLQSETRLADVIAAIQAMGAYKFYKLDFEGWADKIVADKSKSKYWENIFIEHPEFFRLDTERKRASLVIRRQQQKLYNVDEGKTWDKVRYDGLNETEKSRFSRLPLPQSDIQSLVGVAIDLHARAAERARDSRWWIVPLLAFIGAIAGGILPKLLGPPPTDLARCLAVMDVSRASADTPITAQASSSKADKGRSAAEQKN